MVVCVSRSFGSIKKIALSIVDITLTNFWLLELRFFLIQLYAIQNQIFQSRSITNCFYCIDMIGQQNQTLCLFIQYCISCYHLMCLRNTKHTFCKNKVMETALFSLCSHPLINFGFNSVSLAAEKYFVSTPLLIRQPLYS